MGCPVHFVCVGDARNGSVIGPCCGGSCDTTHTRNCGMNACRFFDAEAPTITRTGRFLERDYVEEKSFPPILSLRPSRDRVDGVKNPNILFTEMEA